MSCPEVTTWPGAVIVIGWLGAVVGIAWAVAWRYKNRPTENELILNADADYEERKQERKNANRANRIQDR